jgi:hypothetical protein
MNSIVELQTNALRLLPYETHMSGFLLTPAGHLTIGRFLQPFPYGRWNRRTIILEGELVEVCLMNPRSPRLPMIGPLLESYREIPVPRYIHCSMGRDGIRDDIAKPHDSSLPTRRQPASGVVKIVRRSRAGSWVLLGCLTAK